MNLNQLFKRSPKGALQGSPAREPNKEAQRKPKGGPEGSPTGGAEGGLKESGPLPQPSLEKKKRIPLGGA